MHRIDRCERVGWNQRGMALLITIMTVALLAAVTLEFHKNTWDKYLASRNYMSGVQLSAVADSGIEIALAVLQEDGSANETDSLNDSWALLAREPFAKLFPDGKLHVEVDDLTGRLPVNDLVEHAGSGYTVNKTVAEANRNILDRLLLSGAFPEITGETEARSIVDAIADWIDSDDRESDYGAESSYYHSLPRPYDCKNGPVASIEELLLVRGITPALLFGTGEHPGLADFLTVYTVDGKINLNTAPPLLIKSLDPLIDDNLVQELVDYRRSKDNEEQLAKVSWYRGITGWPGDIILNESMLTTKSSFFQVTSTGAFDTFQRRMVATVERTGPDEVNLLTKKME